MSQLSVGLKKLMDPSANAQLSLKKESKIKQNIKEGPVFRLTSGNFILILAKKGYVTYVV